MNLFDKFCAVFAFILGVLLLLLGALGLFEGCHANFSLPPVAGVAPAIVGWGIVRAIIVAWKRSGDSYLAAPRLPAGVEEPLPLGPDHDRRPV
ncbi:MAG: hypothetical protein ACYS0G_14230 [Planctomycetota bacterium]